MQVKLKLIANINQKQNWVTSKNFSQSQNLVVCNNNVELKMVMYKPEWSFSKDETSGGGNISGETQSKKILLCELQKILV